MRVGKLRHGNQARHHHQPKPDPQHGRNGQRHEQLYHSGHLPAPPPAPPQHQGRQEHQQHQVEHRSRVGAAQTGQSHQPTQAHPRGELGGQQTAAEASADFLPAAPCRLAGRRGVFGCVGRGSGSLVARILHRGGAQTIDGHGKNHHARGGYERKRVGRGGQVRHIVGGEGRAGGRTQGSQGRGGSADLARAFPGRQRQ